MNTRFFGIRDMVCFLDMMLKEGVKTIAKVNRRVVRNQACPKSNFSIRERHNERENESYGNGDILPEFSHLNVHFKSCAGYGQKFYRMWTMGLSVCAV
ncbi:MAG: plasmid recombination protein [Eubacteriaceae bacterium]|nr:plasmid recombination protein [Eubacteriaceae bacterium]